MCNILFRDRQCVVAFSDRSRRDLSKYRLGLTRGRLLGGARRTAAPVSAPVEAGPEPIRRLSRGKYSFFLGNHIISRGREQPLVQLLVHLLVQLLELFLVQPLVQLVVQILVALLVQLLITLRIQLLAGMLQVPAGPEPIRRLSRGRYQLLV